MSNDPVSVEYRLNPDLTNEQLRTFFSDAWPTGEYTEDFAPILAQSLGYICAFLRQELVGFVNVVWDGATHAFLLDPTVRAGIRRQGIGSELVRRARELARSKGAEWLHVDYEPHLCEFYQKCGFIKTEAGLVNLKC